MVIVNERARTNVAARASTAVQSDRPLIRYVQHAQILEGLIGDRGVSRLSELDETESKALLKALSRVNDPKSTTGEKSEANKLIMAIMLTEHTGVAALLTLLERA